MGKISYSQLTNMLSFYLFRYPSIQVALECALEDIEHGDNVELCSQLEETLSSINNGTDEIEALLTLAKQTESKDFEEFALKIVEGKEKKKDIGFFVKGIDPVEYMKNKQPYTKKRPKRNLKKKKR